MRKVFNLLLLTLSLNVEVILIGAQNPIIWADVPDMSMIRVGDTYYMSSTTMHLSPGLPIMKSKDLVNWEIVNYAYNVLEDIDEFNLINGKSAYGGGSWASSLRYYNGVYYVSTFSHTTGKTYIFFTSDIERGTWQVRSFSPALHDHSLFFDEDGKVYMIYGAGDIKLVELKPDLSGINPEGIHTTIITNASLVAGPNIGLPAEGSQLFKINGMYYLFNITWPRGGMRTVIVHRARNIRGPYEGRLALQDKGVAQGGLIDTPTGKWYAYLFRDFGAVGRVPYLVPVEWKDNWPVLGIDGKVPDWLDELPSSLGPIPGIVTSDEFEWRSSQSLLLPQWQWNHNPDNRYWSVNARAGYLRLINGRIDTQFLQVRNMLTQRTFGPRCSGIVSVEIPNMKEGDCAGLALLQRDYGIVGVKRENGCFYVVMIKSQNGQETEVETVRVNQPVIYLRADCDFRNLVDRARFYYSLDGSKWVGIGAEIKMRYTIPHFMGYRFALFNWARKITGGFVDFDYFKISPTTDFLD